RQIGHLDVEERHVRSRGLDPLQGLGSVANALDDLEIVVLAQQLLQELPGSRFILRDQDAQPTGVVSITVTFGHASLSYPVGCRRSSRHRMVTANPCGSALPADTAASEPPKCRSRCSRFSRPTPRPRPLWPFGTPSSTNRSVSHSELMLA